MPPVSPGPVSPGPVSPYGGPVSPALSSGPPDGTRSRLRAVIVVGLVAAVAGLAVLTVTARTSLRGKRPAPPVNAYIQPGYVTDAAAVAHKGAVAVLSIDGQTFGEDLLEAQRWAVDEFGDRITRDVAPAGNYRRWFDYKVGMVAVQTATVTADPDRATVLVVADVADSWRVDGLKAEPRSNRTLRLRWELTMRRFDGGWRISRCVSHTMPGTQPAVWPPPC